MTLATATASGANFDVMKAIDDGGFSSTQKLVYVLAALAIVMDGFDGQMIGYAIPAIMKEWGVTRAAFSVAVASGLVGMAIGSLAAGVIADRVGRKPVLICSIVLFGGATMMIANASGIQDIAAIRFFAGLGIGAALPTSTTLTAEFIPLRFRTMAVTTAIVCYPLGGMLAGLAVTVFYVVRTHPFFGGSMANAWLDINPISAGVFGVPLGFATIIAVSLMTKPPPQEIQDLLDYVRYPDLPGQERPPA